MSNFNINSPLPTYAQFADASNGAVSQEAIKAWHFRFRPNLYEKRNFEKDRQMTIEELKAASIQYGISNYDHLIALPLATLFEREKATALAERDREIALAKSKLTAAETALNAEKRKAQAAETEKKAVWDELETLRTNGAKVAGSEAALRLELARTTTELRELKSELSRTESELTRTATELREKSSSQIETAQELEKKNALVEQLKKCQADAEKLRTELTTKEAELSRTAQELEKMKSEIASFVGGKDVKIIDAVADSSFVFLFFVMSLTFILYGVFIAIYTQQKTLTGDFNFLYMNYILAVGVAIVRQGLRLGLGIASASEFRKGRIQQGYIGLGMTMLLSIFESVDGYEMVLAYHGNLSFHMLIQGIIWSGTLAELRIVFNVIKK